MLFRPKFCANCGEKIERTDWSIFTSRRFCPVCEIEFKGHELIPRAVVAGGILIGLIGVGSYLKSGSSNDARTSLTPRTLVERPISAALPSGVPRTEASPPAAAPAVREPEATVAQTASPRPAPVLNEPQYYCGAETKKGTPCSRRVKGNIRCYQHVGMPAMVGADKLTAKK